MTESIFKPHIFRGYDIRGVVDTDLSPEIMYQLGKAFGTFLHRRQINESVVGRDMRKTSEEYQEHFTKGLLEMGINVVDIGLTLTQIMYFAQYHTLSKSGAMITASHNSKEFNGLKLANGFSETLLTPEINELKEIAISGAFKGYEKPGTLRQEDVFEAYKKDLFKRVPLHDSGLKVVIDASCATTGVFLPTILREAGCDVVEQNTNLDSNFPLGTPDPTEKDVLERLSKGVLESKADLGLAYDSDGDRVGIVDSEGNLIWNDVLVAIFAKDILHFLPGSPIIFNALCSKVTSDTIEKNGGKPIMWVTGHGFIRPKVREMRAPFGGELSGHFFFMDNFYGHDDGAFSTLRLLAFLKRTGLSLKQAVDELPSYVSSPEIKIGVADEIKFDFIKNTLGVDIKNLLPNGTYTDMDGFRADTKEEMVIVRASQNGPYITIKFESKTKEGYQALQTSLRDILKKYDVIDWSKGVNTDAFDTTS